MMSRYFFGMRIFRVFSFLRKELNALKYLRANDCPWNENSLIEAVRHHHLEVIKYCLTNACPFGETNICCFAMSNLWIRNDNDQGLKILKLLCEFSVPWGTGTCEEAAHAENLEGLKWAIIQGSTWNSKRVHKMLLNMEILNTEMVI